VETLKEERGTNGKERQRFLDIIAKETERVIAIVEDLLALARLEKEGEQGTLRIEPHRLRPVAEAALAACRERAAQKRIRLTIEAPDHLEAVINPQLVEQALVNLIDNAVRYSGEETEVTVTAQAADRDIIVTVSDQGPGIPAEHLPRLFERFYRVDKARSAELGGTGLGLAIVKHIAQAHKGSVSVESSLGRGSSFTLRLPAA